MIPRGLNRLRGGSRNVYKGDGKCGMDAQKTKGLAIAQKTGIFQIVFGGYRSFNKSQCGADEEYEDRTYSRDPCSVCVSVGRREGAGKLVDRGETLSGLGDEKASRASHILEIPR